MEQIKLLDIFPWVKNPTVQTSLSLIYMTWICIYTPRRYAIVKHFVLLSDSFPNVLCLYAFLCFLIHMKWLRTDTLCYYAMVHFCILVFHFSNRSHIYLFL